MGTLGVSGLTLRCLRHLVLGLPGGEVLKLLVCAVVVALAAVELGDGGHVILAQLEVNPAVP